jgi:hypothetical protein
MFEALIVNEVGVHQSIHFQAADFADAWSFARSWVRRYGGHVLQVKR